VDSFKELDPETVWSLLKDQENVLKPLADKEQVLFRNSTCPTCGGDSHAEMINARRPFSPGSPLPNKSLKCLACGTEFDPYTRLVTKVSP
jgi:hypothetical protein